MPTETAYPQFADGFGNKLIWDENGMHIFTAGGVPVEINGLPIGGGDLKQADVLVDAASLKNLVASPFSLVAGVASKYLSLVAACYVYHFGTTPYTVDPGANMTIQVGPNPSPALLSQINAPQIQVINGGVDNIYDAGPTSTSIGAGHPPSAVDGLDIFLGLNGGVDATLGDGTLLVSVVYREIPLT